MTRDPLRMYLVLRRGAIAGLARAGELAGAAAVDCVRAFAADPAFADAVAAWRPRPGKVCLRARTAGQWRQVLTSRTRWPATRRAKAPWRCRRARARSAGRCSSACRR